MGRLPCAGVPRRRRDRAAVARNGGELGRYFPELIGRCAHRTRAALRPRRRAPSSSRAEVDGRIRLDWDSLSAHPPAASNGADARRADLRRTSSSFSTHWPPVTGPVLHSWMRRSRRRRARRIPEGGTGKRWCHVTRATRTRRWVRPEIVAASPRGAPAWAWVIAKRLDGPPSYVPGKREMVKVKHARDADCVRHRLPDPLKSGRGRAIVGSILLGLYRDDGESKWSAAPHHSRSGPGWLLAELEPLRKGAATSCSTGNRARWNSPLQRPTSAGSRSGRCRRWPGSPTTRWRVTAGCASATPCGSCAGDPTGIATGRLHLRPTRRPVNYDLPRRLETRTVMPWSQPAGPLEIDVDGVHGGDQRTKPVSPAARHPQLGGGGTKGKVIDYYRAVASGPMLTALRGRCPPAAVPGRHLDGGRGLPKRVPQSIRLPGNVRISG